MTYSRNDTFFHVWICPSKNAVAMPSEKIPSALTRWTWVSWRCESVSESLGSGPGWRRRRWLDCESWRKIDGLSWGEPEFENTYWNDVASKIELRLSESLLLLLKRNKRCLNHAQEQSAYVQEDKPITGRRTCGCLSIVFERFIIESVCQTFSPFTEPLLDLIEIWDGVWKRLNSSFARRIGHSLPE